MIDVDYYYNCVVHLALYDDCSILIHNSRVLPAKLAIAMIERLRRIARLLRMRKQNKGVNYLARAIIT